MFPPEQLLHKHCTVSKMCRSTDMNEENVWPCRRPALSKRHPLITINILLGDENHNRKREVICYNIGWLNCRTKHGETDKLRNRLSRGTRFQKFSLRYTKEVVERGVKSFSAPMPLFPNLIKAKPISAVLAN